MKNTLSDNILLQLSEFIASTLALYFPKERWDDLDRNISAAAKEFGYQDAECFVRDIISSYKTREHFEILASYLTIKETYFWREPPSFEILEKKILPELIHIREKEEKRIRIWSAGCSSGEEPYSIAIAVRRCIPDISKWNVTILATDVNPKIMQKANAGIYSPWSFRNAPQWLKEKYFWQNGKAQYEIIPEIKSMVTFEYLNLAEDVFPSTLNNTNAMDVVFCRNVLMYFTPGKISQVADGLFNSIVEGGYLIVGACELNYQHYLQFTPVNFSSGTVYRKIRRYSIHSHDVGFTEATLQRDFIRVNPADEKVSKPVALQTVAEAVTPIQAVEKEILLPSKYEEAMTLYSQGSYAEMIDKFGKYAHTPDELLLVARSYANQGKLTHALTLCEQAIALDKLDPKIHYLYATILQENNQADEAIAAHKRAVYLDPDYILSYYSLGNLLLGKGNRTGARKCYLNALSVLEKQDHDEIIPESEGLTTGRFREIIYATIQTRSLI
jgi:chemotaxis protein methyltransferase CheR